MFNNQFFVMGKLGSAHEYTACETHPIRKTDEGDVGHNHTFLY
jgi:hypothetical protein